MKNKQFNSEINEQILEEIDNLENLNDNEKDLIKKFLIEEKNYIQGKKNTYTDKYLEILEEFYRTK